MSGTIRTWLLATGALTAIACAGCYDASALVDQVRYEALRSQTYEIHLGLYRTTMPRDPITNAITEIELRLFGTAPQYKISAIQKQLAADKPKLRYETLVAIRNTTAEELGEPDLGTLRARLMQVTNRVLKDAPIQSIGVQKIRIAEKR
jgi:hypothetical protein